MSLINKIHWYSAAAVNTVSESEDDDRTEPEIKKKEPIQKVEAKKTPSENLRELVLSVRILIIQNCRTIKFRDSCDAPLYRI